MKILLMLCLAVAVVSTASYGEEAQPTAYGQYFTLVVTDPQAVVSAMSKYRESATGQKLSSNSQLTQIVANGSEPATHAVAVFYPSAAAMSADHGAAAQSSDWAEFIDTMSGIATVHSENVFSLRRSRINDEAVGGSGAVTMLFALDVSDPGRYQPAMNAMFDSSAVADFPGNVFGGEIMASGEDAGTHWVSFQSSDIGTLLSGMEAFLASDDFASYAADADQFREVVGRVISRNVRGFGPPME